MATATLKERQGRPAKDLGTFGPFGDKDLYGSLLKDDTGKAEPNDNNELEQPVTWTFTGYVPKNKAELAVLLAKKPDMLLDLVQDKLMTKYRAQSWAEVRGGNVTADIRVTVNGKVTESKRVPLTAIETMRSMGATVEIIPRVKPKGK